MLDPDFQCSTCNEVFPDINQHAHHQKSHATKPNYLFDCGSCVLKFSNFRTLCSHISKCHKRARREAQVQEVPGVKCSYCNEQPETLVLLIKHLKNEHLAKGTDIRCPLKNCGRSDVLTSVSIFSKHLSQQHKGWQGLPSLATKLVQGESSRETQNSDIGDDDNAGVFGGCDDVDDNTEEGMFYEGDSTYKYKEAEIWKFIADFYLKLESECFISVESIEKISTMITLLSEMTLSYMKDKLMAELFSHNLEKQTVEDIICKLVDSDILFLSHHKTMRGPSLNTEYLRRKIYMSNPNFVAPEPCNLSEDPLAPDVYQYVSIEDTLKRLLCDPSVKREVLKSFERFANAAGADVTGSTVYRDYTDGSVCKGRNLPARRIDIIMFQDGCSTTSMMTTTRNKHKTLGCYWALGNIPTHLRTKLKAINLVFLMLEEHVKKYRQMSFEKLVCELQKMQIDKIEFEGELIPIFVQYVAGDNLGQAFLGGWIESFTNGFVCRFCLIQAKEYRANPTLVKADRTVADYNRSVVTTAATGKNHHGVKESSALNKLDTFHVCDPGLPVCLGHDLFHGIANWDLACMIDHFVENGWFSYETLNRRISQFKYSPIDSKNKPAPVKGDGKKLGGSAVQNWTLIRLLPLIIEGKIKDPDDSHWKLYLKLKTMCEYICAPATTDPQIDLLDILIISYLQDRVILKYKRMKLKGHLLAHYCALMRKFGPLIHCWAMRFEQKHRIFKTIARTCNNFVNLLSTLAVRHQFMFTYQSDSERFPEGVSKCKPFPMKPDLFEHDVATLIDNTFSSEVQMATSIKINNLTYREGNWMILLQPSADLIHIGNIKAILLHGSQVYFIFRKQLATLNASFGIFEIDEESVGELVIQDYKDILHPCPQAVYNCNDLLCFSLKHMFPPPP